MKKISYVLAALMVIAACEGEGSQQEISPICGEWESLKIDNEGKLYLSFEADGGFEIFQFMKTEGYELYRGKWSVRPESNILSGTYNDGESWAYSYEFLICPDADSTHVENPVDTLKLKATEDRSIENVFVSCHIPTVVRETADVVVKGRNSDTTPAL